MPTSPSSRRRHHPPRSRRVGAALVAVAVAVVALGGTAGAKTISDDKYAKRLCGEMNKVLDAVDAIEAPTTSDPATYQTESIAAVNEIIDAMKSAKTKLAKLSPEDGGKKVTRTFNRYLRDFIAEFEDARDEFAEADPASPAFSGAVAIFVAAISTSEATLGDPFAGLTGNQDLLNAFGDTRSCADIVTIF